ncbi:formyltransferase family protein [Tunicatimonas pelagia]|uniref:formyltransferase family protein n=1 Tax=Tunicatimonas pelagia TaxID=931531 RepID=UPI002666E619|nr:formyltransferase family protein [Tunicatimonas pelagia]WKN45151.1 formyltransferase family protein [Tunicatimonas pelagia]
MRFVIVGNNDGPLTLLQSLQGTNLSPVVIGLQKNVDSQLLEQYEQYVSSDRLLVGFNQAKLADWLAGYSITYLINCFCNFKFTTLLDRYQVLNVHLAPLPRYRGRHPLPWALINGEKTFGITIHQMTNEIDGGDIYWQKEIPIVEAMSVQDLRTNLMEQLRAGFGTFLTDFAADSITSQPNNDQEATYVARRYPQDSELTEWHDRDLIIRKVMALRSTNDPAFLSINDQTVKVHRASWGSRVYVGVAAPFVSQVQTEQVEIVCQDGQTVWLSNFEPESISFSINQRI